MIKYFEEIKQLKKKITFTDKDDVFILKRCSNCGLDIKKDNLVYKKNVLSSGKRIAMTPKVVQEIKCVKCNSLVGYDVYNLRINQHLAKT